MQCYCTLILFECLFHIKGVFLQSILGNYQGGLSPGVQGHACEEVCGSGSNGNFSCIRSSLPAAAQPKVNRLWDLLEKVPPVCRTDWGWGAWRDNGQAQADQVPVIPDTNKTASRLCVQTAGLSHPSPSQPCMTFLGEARSRLRQQPHSPRHSEATPCSRLKLVQREGALCTWSQLPSQHEAACAECNSPLSHLNKIPNLPTFQINAVYEPHQLPVRSYSNTKAEANSALSPYHRWRTGSWEVWSAGTSSELSFKHCPCCPGSSPASTQGEQGVPKDQILWQAGFSRTEIWQFG